MKDLIGRQHEQYELKELWIICHTLSIIRTITPEGCGVAR